MGTRWLPVILYREGSEMGGLGGDRMVACGLDTV